MSGILRKRDFVVLALVAIGAFLSLDTNDLTFTFEPAWYIDQRSHSSSWNPIPPIIADLRGTGNNDLIVISKESEDLILKVASADDPREDRSRVYIPNIIASTPLMPMKLQKGRTPVAMKTGYIDAYNITVSRQQVVVVVREDWSVSCYDASLKLLWEKAVAHKSHDLQHLIDKFKIDEVGIYLSPLSLTENSKGLVIVGASMTLRDPDDFFMVQQGLKIDKDGERERLDMNHRAALEHFSIYALDARTGQVVWRHDGLEVKPEQYVKSLPQLAYKLDVRDLATKVHKAPAVHDWTTFRQSLIAELPHIWQKKDDTSMRLAHFVRHHVGSAVEHAHGRRKSAHKSEVKPKDIAPKHPGKPSDKKRPTGKAPSNAASERRFTGVETPPLGKSASLPHDASEHTDHPNVIVSHTSRGIEVIALKTGTPITSLALSAGRSYADIDGDGVVDTITVLENEQDVSLMRGHGSVLAAPDNLRHCMIAVTSGLPQRSELFSGTICGGSHFLQEPLVSDPDPSSTGRNNKGRGSGRSKSYRYSSGSAVPAAISATPPVFLRTIDPKTLLESKARDVMVAINTGIVTCYAADGDFRWQIRGGPKWQVDEKDVAAAMLFDADALRVAEVGSHDTVHANALVVGARSFSLISKDGYILSDVELPNKPVGRPVLGDFDNDGVTDVIIITNEAILGYRLIVSQSVRGMLIAVVVMAVLAAIVFFANIRTMTQEEIEKATGAAAAATGSGSSSNTARVLRPLRSPKKKSILSIIRSTDEHHID